MAGELAQLGIQVTTNADKASADLDKLASSSAKAEQATTSLSKSSASSAASTSGLTKAQQEYIALVQAGIPVHQRYIDAVGGATAAEKLLAASKGASATASNAATVATNTLARAHGGLSTQAMALSHSIRGAAEMLAQGVPPSRVLAMELNNITYAATGPGGLAGAFKSLTQGALGTALKFAAMASPILAAVAFMGALAAAAYKSAAANVEFENTLAGIGRTGSASLADVDKAASQANSAIGVSVSSAHEWAQTYATVGKVGGDVLTGLTSITKQYADATGKDTTDAVKALADAFADPAKGAETLNDQLGFLNATQLTHIKQLADEGDRLGAQKALYADLNKALDETSQVHVTGLVKAWRDVATWAGNAWHAMVIAAGGGDLIENLAQAEAKLANMQKIASLPGNQGSVIQNQLKADEQAVADAKKALADYDATVLKTQRDSAANTGSTKAKTLLDNIFPDDATIQKLKADYGTLANAADAAAKAGRPPDPQVAAGMKVVEDAINRVTDAYNKYGGSAGVAHQIAVLQAQAASTTDQATKGQIATQIHLLQTLGDLTPAQQRLTAAEDAGALSASRHTKAIKDESAAADSIINKYAAQYEHQTDQLDKAKERLDEYNKSLSDGVQFATVTSDERERLLAVEKEIKLAAEAQVPPQTQIAYELVRQRQEAEQLGRVADGVQSSFQDFFTTVFSGGKDAFHNLVDSIKSQFAQLLAWMVTQAIAQPIIVPIIGAITGGAVGAAGLLGAGGLGGASGIGNIFGSLGTISSAGSLAGSSGFLGGIGSQISSAASWLTSGINNIGASLGFSAGTSFGGISTVGVTPSVLGTGGFAAPNIAGSSSLLGGTTLSGLLGGAGMGLGVGNLVGSLTGGNSLGSSIGGALGGAIGSVVPVIGTLLGSAVGGAIGGLFGPGKTAGKASATFDANGVITGYGGDKATDKSSQAVQSAAQAISQTVQTLQSAGVDISNSISKLVIADNRDKSFILTASGQKQTVGAVGDPNSAIQGTLDYLLKGASSSDANISQVLKHYQATGGITSSNASQVASDIAFAKSLENISFDTTKQLSQAATALKSLNDNYQTAIDRAKSLGLSTDSLTKAQAHDVALLQKSTSDAYVAQFQSVTQGLQPLSSYQSAIKGINDTLTQAVSDMNDLGGSLIDVTNAANQAKAALASAFNTDIQSQLLGIVNSAASSYQQLAAAEAQRVADAQAVGGDLTLVNQLNAAEMQKFIVGLSDADRALLVSAGILTSAQSAAAKAVTVVSDGIDSLIDRATAAGQAAQQASQAWSSAQQSLDQSRNALLISGPGVSPQNAYLAAQAQYADLLQKAQTDPAQAQAFASFASQFLQTSLAYNATGGAYGSDFSKVQDDLAKLSMTAGTQATAQDKLAALSQSSLDALNAMKAQLASGAPNIGLLQQQLSAQNSIVAAIEAGNLITAQTASLTTSAIAAQISANDNALISAIVAAVPAVAPVIAAAPVAQTSAPTQAATSGQASSPSTATDPAVVAAIDRLTQNVIEMKQAQVLTANALRQGNMQNRFAVNK